MEIQGGKSIELVTDDMNSTDGCMNSDDGENPEQLPEPCNLKKSTKVRRDIQNQSPNLRDSRKKIANFKTMKNAKSTKCSKRNLIESEEPEISKNCDTDCADLKSKKMSENGDTEEMILRSRHKKPRQRVTFRPLDETQDKAAAVRQKENSLEMQRKQQWIINSRAWDTPVWWCLLALLRVVLATYQTSYLHPDEFHQSLQVRARDVLQIEGQKPWEYTSSTPIRSIVFSGLVALPFSALRWLQPHASYYLNWNLLTPQMLLLTPRLFMTLLSFISDLCVYKIARMCYLRPWQCMEVYASSYVMLVYATKTFSNTLELILMSVVLWRVSLSIVDSTKVIRRETLIEDLYQSAEELRHKVRLARLKSSLPPYNYGDSFLLSVVVTLGVFIRPTFLIYSFIPVAYWLQRGIMTHELNFRYFNLRSLSLLPGIIITFLLCVLADSFYYETITAEELVFGNVTANSFVLTPLNFYVYNRKSENVVSHGEHPHFLHFLVNLPLLHGVLAFVGLYHASLFISTLFSSRRITRKPKIYSLATMLMLSFVVPVLILSFIPHQEARFLLPTLPMLVLLHSDKVSLHNFFRLRFTKHFLFLMWHSWNIFCVIFFGFLHQGGVTSAVIGVHDYVQSKPADYDTPIHVYFSHMYTAPTFLLMRKIEVVAVTLEGRKFRVPRTIYSHHLSGSTSAEKMSSVLYAQLNNRTKISALTPGSTNTALLNEVLLCLPGSVADDLILQNTTEGECSKCDGEPDANSCHVTSTTCDVKNSASKHNENKRDKLQFELLQRIPMHVNLENLPSRTLRATPGCDEMCSARKKLYQFSVELYKVSLTSDMKEI